MLFIDDVRIRFYQENADGDLVWEDFGDFSANDIHRQVSLDYWNNSHIYDLMMIHHVMTFKTKQEFNYTIECIMCISFETNHISGDSNVQSISMFAESQPKELY